MIHIANLQKKIRIPTSRLKTLVAKILKGEKAGDLTLSFAFVGNRRIRTLNRRFLQHDYATDVIAFALGEPGEAGGVHGEVVISAEFAGKEARTRGIPVQEELLRYAAHGVLHLLGYDDHTPAKKKMMWARQEKYLKTILRGPAGTRPS